MSLSRPDIEARVTSVVAEALSRDVAEVKPHASFIDDLGAESIDFLDIGFRLESAFEVKIPSDELWRGSLTPDDPRALAEGLRRLRERMPDFDWSRFPAEPQRHDLPRLITVRTVVDYLERRLAGDEQPASGARDEP